MKSKSADPARPHAVVLAALPLEFLAVRRHLTDVVEHVTRVGAVYDRACYTGPRAVWDVTVVQTGAGNTDAALEAERAVADLDPTHLLFVGVAGGLKDVRLGDVVAATKVYHLHAGKDDGALHPRPAVVTPAYALVQRALAVTRDGRWMEAVRYGDDADVGARAPAGAERPPDPWPIAHVAPIVAGEQVVASRKGDAFQFARAQYGDAIAVEMEGYGALRALYARPAVGGLVVRGISDVVAAKGAADATGWQPVAAAHAAAFAFAVLDGLAVDGIVADATPPGAAAGGSADGHAPEASHATRPAWERDPRVLAGLAARLYPLGPEDRYAWRRAGGDPATLAFGMSGASAWYGALTLLANGGGGRDASAARLVAVMREEFGNDPDVIALGTSDT